MKLFGYDIEFKKQIEATNLTNRNDRRFTEVIKYDKELTRTHQDVGKWRRAVMYAESGYNYNREEYYRLLKDVVIDSHLSSVMMQRDNMGLGRKVVFYNYNGEMNEEITKLFQADWFMKMRKMIYQAKYYGFNMIDFGELVDFKFPYICEVPRQYVKPEYGVVVSHPSMNTGTDIDDKAYEKWNMFVGETYDLGLLMKAAPWVLWKKNVTSYWSEYCEKFGMPMRIGKTNVNDNVLVDNMERNLKKMGAAFYGIMDKDDEIQLLETFNTAAYDIYDKFIDRANSEISKLILGQTGTTDEKSFAGSAGVHQDLLKQIAESDCKYHDSVLNEILKPKLIALGFQLSDGYFETTYEDTMNLMQKSELVVKMMPFVNFDKEYLEKEFGLEIESLKTPTGNKTISNELRKYYDSL